MSVSDASPLIVFHQIGRLDLAAEVLGETWIPQAVAREIAPSLGSPPQWIRVKQVRLPAALMESWSALDLGELEAIALMQDISAARIALDDRKARKAAAQLGLPIVGSLGILAEARRRNLIGDVRPDLDAMRQAGFRISRALRREILEMAGQSD